MMNINEMLGTAGRSVESVRSMVGVPRPASLRDLVTRFVADVVIRQPIMTDDGVALGGEHQLLLRRDGTYDWSGTLRATGFPSYKCALVAHLDAPGLSRQAFAAQGTVHGTNELGDRAFRFSQQGDPNKPGQAAFLASQWSALRQGRLSFTLSYDVNWLGAAGDVLAFLGQVAAGAAFGPLGTMLVLLGTAADALDLEQFTLPLTIGIIAAGGACFVLGPSMMFPAFVLGAAATPAVIKQREMDDNDLRVARRVFGDTVPYDRVRISNITGAEGRPFTTPGPGGVILLNLGTAYERSYESTSNGQEENKRAPGQLLIHELTHAWQIANHCFTPLLYCEMLVTIAGTTGGQNAAYTYGDAGPEWHQFGTEQQGAIVDQWYAGNGRQQDYGARAEDEKNPYWRYIRDNIRAGRP